MNNNATYQNKNCPSLKGLSISYCFYWKRQLDIYNIPITKSPMTFWVILGEQGLWILSCQASLYCLFQHWEVHKAKMLIPHRNWMNRAPNRPREKNWWAKFLNIKIQRKHLPKWLKWKRCTSTVDGEAGKYTERTIANWWEAGEEPLNSGHYLI